MVVGEIAVLVVWRIQISEIERTDLFSQFVCVTSDRFSNSRQEFRYPEFKIVEGTWCPFLHVSHLHAGR